MSTKSVHDCPRCELRFTHPVELFDHMRRDHAEPERPAARPDGRIVLAVDPARAAPAVAVGVASALATQVGAAIEVVATTPPGLGDDTTHAYLQERVRECRAARAPWVTWHGLDGAPATAVVEEAGHGAATWICLATQARTAVAEKVFGSVAEEVLRTTRVPAVMIGPRAETTSEPFTRVLVCAERKPAARRVVAAGADLARRLGCRLVITQVSIPTIDGDPLLDDRHLRQLAKTTAPPADTVLLAGHREWEPILALAEDDPTTILVTGRRPADAPGCFVAGSIATNLARKAHGPIMVVPNPTEL